MSWQKHYKNKPRIALQKCKKYANFIGIKHEYQINEQLESDSLFLHGMTQSSFFVISCIYALNVSRVIPFKDHINVEAKAVIQHKEELARYKITPKGMVQIYLKQDMGKLSVD